MQHTMRLTRLRVLVVLAVLLAVVAMADPGCGQPKHGGARLLAQTGAAPIPLVNSHVDMLVIDPPFIQVVNSGGNVPYRSSGGGTTDFSEVNCQLGPPNNTNWCYLKDSVGDCMNVPTTGEWAFYVVSSSCPSNYTPEEWARFAVEGGWSEQNRHTGDFLDLNLNICTESPPDGCPTDVDTNGAFWTWNYPAS